MTRFWASIEYGCCNGGGRKYSAALMVHADIIEATARDLQAKLERNLGHHILRQTLIKSPRRQGRCEQRCRIEFCSLQIRASCILFELSSLILALYLPMSATIGTSVFRAAAICVTD